MTEDKRQLRILEFLLKQLIPIIDQENLTGDFEEMYNLICRRSGKVSAQIWHITQILKLIPSYFKNLPDLFRLDVSLFYIFTFPLLKGNPQSALEAPNTVVISETIALKYFGNEEAINRTLEIDEKEFVVTGVMKNMPKNSHFYANIFAWPTAYILTREWLQSFAYRIGIGYWIFLLSAVLAFAIAPLAVSFQAIKAAAASPADSLRYE